MCEIEPKYCEILNLILKTWTTQNTHIYDEHVYLEQKHVLEELMATCNDHICQGQEDQTMLFVFEVQLST